MDGDFTLGLQDVLPAASMRWGDIDPQTIRISPTVPCVAGCSELRYAVAADEPLMLKHLHAPDAFGTDQRTFRERLNDKIMRTVMQHADEFSKGPYVELRGITDADAYLTNRYPGVSVGLILAQQLAVLSNVRKGQILATLADHVGAIHDEGMLKVDYNWGDVIIASGEIRICDYDLLSTPDELEEFPELAHIGCCHFKSREQYLGQPVTSAGEVERLALMAYTLFTSDYLWHECDVDEGLPVEAARIGIPFFTSDHAEQMPPNLGRLVEHILDPDGHDHSAHDIARAVRRDYAIDR